MLTTVRSPHSVAILCAFALLLTPAVVAECTAPSSPGVRICSPTPNATVVYAPSIDFNSTPESGTTVLKFAVYDNDEKIEEGLPGQSGEQLIDFAIRNGTHNIVINMWDSNGNLHQNRVSFRVVGDGFPLFCPLPTSPGINFCEPPDGVALGSSYQVSASATGLSAIAAMRLYVDGEVRGTFTDTNQLATSASVGTQGNHTVAWVAWDSTGHVFNSTRTIRSTYTYMEVDCPPKGNGPCSPGFAEVTPNANDYVDTNFTIQTSIDNNPRSITTMKAYIDNTVVATSNGPIMNWPVTNAPDGTHVLTLQAWDTEGVLYRIQRNININVSH